MTTATIKNLRISAKKVRLVADLVRGMKVDEALAQLKFSPKGAAQPVAKLISSAASNAVHNDEADESRLQVAAIVVNEAPTYKRIKPRARGQADRINKRGSHVTVTLSEV